MQQVVIDQLTASRAEFERELEQIEKAIARKGEVLEELERIDAGLAGLTGTAKKTRRKSGAAKTGPKPGGRRKRRGANPEALASVTESAASNGAGGEAGPS